MPIYNKYACKDTLFLKQPQGNNFLSDSFLIAEYDEVALAVFGAGFSRQSDNEVYIGNRHVFQSVPNEKSHVQRDGEHMAFPPHIILPQLDGIACQRQLRGLRVVASAHNARIFHPLYATRILRCPCTAYEKKTHKKLAQLQRPLLNIV